MNGLKENHPSYICLEITDTTAPVSITISVEIDSNPTSNNHTSELLAIANFRQRSNCIKVFLENQNDHSNHSLNKYFLFRL